ncbi:MAG TPA: dihydrodipicolinate synthase family protein, partial [Acidimicrobiales bacterium]
GALDLDAAASLARWLVDQGNDGLVVAGTTGEGATLTDDEKVDLWRAVREAVTVPVVAGTGTYDTRHTIHLTERAAEVGVDGALVVTPYYNRPSQAGLEAHFRAVAAAPGFEVYSGNDDQTLALLAVGAVGVIGVATHWSAGHHAEMIAAFAKGDVARAREVNARLLASYAFETSDEAPNPIPTKAMLRVLGHRVGHCRPPVGPTPDGLEDRARAVLAGLT